MVPWFLLFLLPNVLAQGSGDGLPDDDDWTSEIVPTRVIPELQTPSVSSSSFDSVNFTPIEPSTEDSIYFEEAEEGSGERPLVTATPPFIPAPDASPRLRRKLKKLPVISGKSLRWKIPADTFQDEDGDTRKLQLSMRHMNGSDLSNTDWIRFDTRLQVLHVLSVNENDIGRWKFHLFAQDKSGNQANDTLELVIRQYPGTRLVNHQFSMKLTLKQWNSNLANTWKWRVLDKIRRYFGDNSLENILVRSTSMKPLSISWSNSSLIGHSCNQHVINDIFSQMASDRESSQPSDAFQKSFYPEAVIQSIHVNFFGTCTLNEFDTRISDENENNVPIVRNPIDVINVTAGEYLEFAVPKDTCYDKEDGDTRALNLQLLTMSRKELSVDSWLYFDSRNQEFIGIPLEEEVGREEFQLVCSDANGLSVIDGIEVVVLNRPFSERFGTEILFRFNSDISHKRVMLVELIASYMGDSTPRNVVLKSVNEGEVVWYNKSLAYASCDDPKVTFVSQKLTEGSRNRNAQPHESQVSIELQNHFQPLAMLRESVVLKKGSCILTHNRDNDKDKSDKEHGIFHGIMPSFEYLMTFLIPAVIIIIMLLLAILLACMLHRKRQAGKLNLFYSETLPPRVPVILQEELNSGQQDQNIFVKYEPHEADSFLVKENQAIVRPTPVYQR